MTLFCRRIGGWLTPAMNLLRNVWLNFRIPSLSIAATRSWTALRRAPRWLQNILTCYMCIKVERANQTWGNKAVFVLSWCSAMCFSQTNMIQVLFLTVFYHILTGTQPRKGHCRDQKNDGYLQREESCSIIKTYSAWLKNTGPCSISSSRRL